MPTKELTGVDVADLDRKQWEWQQQNAVTILRIHPDERLPLKMRLLATGAKLTAEDRFSRRIEYTAR